MKLLDRSSGILTIEMYRTVVESRHLVYIDESDVLPLLTYTWCIRESTYTYYLQAREPGGGRSGKTVSFHRLICSGETIDHIDGNGLNNTRTNLRSASKAQNLMNRGKQSNNSSGYKGVHWCKVKRKWQAQIRTMGRGKFLGYFSTAEEAAAAYDRAAAEFHGEFAHLNFGGSK